MEWRKQNNEEKKERDFHAIHRLLNVLLFNKHAHTYTLLRVKIQ